MSQRLSHPRDVLRGLVEPRVLVRQADLLERRRQPLRRKPSPQGPESVDHAGVTGVAAEEHEPAAVIVPDLLVVDQGAAEIQEPPLRIDLRPRGIDVTVIAPGFIDAKPPKNRNRRKQKKRKIRPFKLELEPATERIARAIQRRRPYYAFPKSLVVVLWASHLLPIRLFDRILVGRGPRVTDAKRRQARSEEKEKTS